MSLVDAFLITPIATHPGTTTPVFASRASEQWLTALESSRWGALHRFPISVLILLYPITRFTIYIGFDILQLLSARSAIRIWVPGCPIRRHCKYIHVAFARRYPQGCGVCRYCRSKYRPLPGKLLLEHPGTQIQGYQLFQCF
jgi:hypothetical protein